MQHAQYKHIMPNLALNVGMDCNTQSLRAGKLQTMLTHDAKSKHVCGGCMSGTSQHLRGHVGDCPVALA